MLLVEGGVAQSVLLSCVGVVSVGDAFGVDCPYAAQIEGLFSNPSGATVAFAAPGDVTVTDVPVSGNSTGDTVSFTYGNGTNLTDPLVLGSETVSNL